MKKIIALFIFSILLSSCNEYKEIISDIAIVKIKIYLWKDGHLDREGYFFEITDDNEIKKIFQWITSIESPAYKCGYNGAIEFYCKNNNLLMDAEFNTECNTIVFEYNNKFYKRRMTGVGINYINKIIEKINDKNDIYLKSDTK